MSRPSTTNSAWTVRIPTGPAASQQAQGEAPPARRTGGRRSQRHITVKIALMPGSEPWFAVTHPTGTFKVPGDVSLLEAFTLAMNGATTARKPRSARRFARVSVELVNYLMMRPGHLAPPLSSEGAAEYQTLKRRPL